MIGIAILLIRWEMHHKTNMLDRCLFQEVSPRSYTLKSVLRILDLRFSRKQYNMLPML